MPTTKQLRRAALKLLREHIVLRRGERVALLTDRRNDPIYSALLWACAELGAPVRTQRIRSGRLHSSPIPEAKAALLWADVVLAPTDASITHSSETVLACRKGLRGASMPAISPALFVKGLAADSKRVAAAGKKILKALKGAKRVRVQSPGGSDFVLFLGSRRATENGPDLSVKGEVTNIPFGEVYVAPLETKGEGRITFDAWLGHKGTVFLHGGRIADWDAGGAKYVAYLKKAGPCGLVIAELGFGTNPAHTKPEDNILSDEKIYGSVHVAFGQNISFGGKNKCGVHEDAVILRPTVLVDGKPLVVRGKII